MMKSRAAAIAALFVCLISAPAHADMVATPVLTGLSKLRDTASDARGRHFYFIADGSRGPAVFRLTLRNGRVRELWSGMPLVSPVGIAVSDDGEVYIADPAARGGGGVFALDDDDLRLLARGYHARGVEVRDGDVFFTGENPRSGLPGLFRIREHGRVDVVAQGAPFHRPIGVALGRQGDAWVSDEIAPGLAVVLHVEQGSVTVVTHGLRAGTPPGIALTRDERTVALSGLDAMRGTALVYLVDTGSFAVTTANNGIAQNIGAGGLHRAAKADVFGWCGIASGGRGSIYSVTF